MLLRKTKKNVLLSFVGINDSGKLQGPADGAILTVFKELKFDEVYLLWNHSTKGNDFRAIAEYVKKEIVSKRYCKKVTLVEFDCKDVTDHNEIYPKLLSICRSLPVEEGIKYTAAIASGTPSMQVCWILIAESGDFPLSLIRSNEPRFGKPYVRSVKLGTGLPRILHLQERVVELEKDKNLLIPAVKMNVSLGEIKIGESVINLSPIEFSYYRYFLERTKYKKEPERFSGINVPNEFLVKVVQFHKESFPESELFRDQLLRMIKNRESLALSTFRGNISKTNKKISHILKNDSLAQIYFIQRTGKRHATSYGISIPSDKISISKT